MLVAVWPFWMRRMSEMVSLVMFPARLGAWILSELQKSVWWLTKSSAKGGTQMPNVAQRTGASASLKHCSSKQSNDKVSGWRKGEEDAGLKSRIEGALYGILRICRVQISLGKEECDTHWGAALAPDYFTLSTLDFLWHLNSGQNSRRRTALKEVREELLVRWLWDGGPLRCRMRGRPLTAYWIAHHLWSHRNLLILWTTQLDGERSPGAVMNEDRQIRVPLPGSAAEPFWLTRNCRLLMMKKGTRYVCGNCTWWGILSLETSSSEVLHIPVISFNWLQKVVWQKPVFTAGVIMCQRRQRAPFILFWAAPCTDI